jgi:hypothetical protein
MLVALAFRGPAPSDSRTALFPEMTRQLEWMRFFCKDARIHATPEGDFAACSPCPKGEVHPDDDLLLFDGALEFRAAGDAWALLLVQGCGAETQGSRGATHFLRRAQGRWTEVDRMLGNHACLLLQEGREALFFCESTELARGITETRWEALQVPSLKRSTLFSFTSQDDVLVDEVRLQKGAIEVHSGGSVFTFRPDKSGWRPTLETEDLIQSLMDESEPTEPGPDQDTGEDAPPSDEGPKEA